jgi:DHA2 family methylenomycin A resistance protein-like MFS transporter
MGSSVAGDAGRSNSLTLAAMSLGYGVVQLDVTIVNVAVNSIGQSVGGGVAALQWVVNAYTIAFAALILTAGALGDRIGARRVFMTGFAIFTMASLACALAPNLPILIAARAAQGLAAAILVPNSLALLNHAHPGDKERGRAVAIWAAGASLALTAGPLVGGGLIAIAGWRSIFLVNVPLGLTALWLTSRYSHETTKSSHHKLDLPGQASVILALGCLAGAMIEGGKRGWSDAFVLAGFAAFAIATLAFLRIEQRTDEPMLPLSLFRNAQFSATSLIGLLINIAFYGLIFLISLYLQQTNGLSPLWTGLAFAPMTAAVFVPNLIAPRLANWIGSGITIAAGALVGAASCLALLCMDQDPPYGAMVVQFITLGAGLGLLVPPLTSTMLGSVDKTRSGLASGVLNSMRQTGSVLGVALFGSLAGSLGGLVPGLRSALIISACLLACSAAAALIGVTNKPLARRTSRADRALSAGRPHGLVARSK